jgi:hypothetical protein
VVVSRRGSRSIEHLGSAHYAAELAALKAGPAERFEPGHAVLDLCVAGPPGSQPLAAAKGDSVFRDLVLARIIGPTSKIGAERVLSEVGVAAAFYATAKRSLPSYERPSWRQSLAVVSARHAAGEDNTPR